MKVTELYSLFEASNLFTKEMHLDRNEYLSTSGAIDTDIYFIKEGSLKIYVVNDAEEQIIRFGYQNDIIASLDSFLSGKPSDFYIQAIKKTTVKVISKTDFIAFLNSDPGYLKLWIAILEDMVLQADGTRKRLVDHIAKRTIRTRFKKKSATISANSQQTHCKLFTNETRNIVAFEKILISINF